MDNINNSLYCIFKNLKDTDTLTRYFITVLKDIKTEYSEDKVDKYIYLVEKLQNIIHLKDPVLSIAPIRKPFICSNDDQFIIDFFKIVIPSPSDRFHNLYHIIYDRPCKEQSTLIFQQLNVRMIYEVSNFVYYNMIKEIKMHIIKVCRIIMENEINETKDDALIEEYNNLSFNLTNYGKNVGKPSYNNLENYQDLLKPEHMECEIRSLAQVFKYIKYPICILYNLFKMKEHFTILFNYYNGSGKLHIYLLIDNTISKDRHDEIQKKNKQIKNK